MNANAARLVFLIATLAVLVAFSFDAAKVTTHPHVAAGMLESGADTLDAETPAPQLSVALQSTERGETRR